MKVSTFVADDEIAIVEIEGAVDAYTARELDTALKDLLAQGHHRLVLDASQMGFISSAGLRVIVSAEREARLHGGRVQVCGLNAQAQRTFEIAGLDEVLHLSETREQALAGW